MSLFDYLKENITPVDSTTIEDNQGPVTPAEPVKKDNNYYYNMKNPETGRRYDIPMLSTIDPGYYFKYVSYMQLKEDSPRTFEKIMSWE